MTIKKEVFVCMSCGSENVQTVMWVGMNDLIVDGNYGPDEGIDTNWCKDCERHVEIELKEIIK